MGFFDRIDRHADLLKRMADTVHADIGEAMERGAVQGDEIRRAVFTCMGCTGASECPSWMDAHETGSDSAPAYCRNRGWLARIAG